MAAILFIDIRGFTAMAEKMQPEDIVALLTEFRSIVTDQVFIYDGTVDKFIGDSVMAVFGTPESREDDSQRAVRCGLAILETVRKWSKERRVRGDRSISIGIGAHYGEVFAGTVGNERLMEFTVLGDTVNVAARLEKVCSEIGGSFVISETLFHASGGGLDPSAWQSLAPFRLSGRAQEITAFSLHAAAYGDNERQSPNENRMV
jgi:adenylate cyclase